MSDDSLQLTGSSPCDLSRELFDVRRAEHGRSGESVCHAPANSLSLDRTGRWAPCRFSAFRYSERDPAAAWSSTEQTELWQRFLDYRVSNDHCGACTAAWRDDRPDESPACELFDQFPASQPQAPRVLSLDGEAQLDQAAITQVRAWLPGLDRLELTLAREPESWYRILLQDLAELPAGRPAQLAVFLEAATADATHLPRQVSRVVVRDLDGTLAKDGGQALRDLAAAARERGGGVEWRVGLDQHTWFELRGWLRHARLAGAALVPIALPPPYHASLAGIDGDLLSVIHHLSWQWSEDISCGAPDSRARVLFQRYLNQLRRWQGASEPVEGCSNNLSYPPFHHELVASDTTLLPFLAAFLRAYSHPGLEQFLAEIVGQSEQFPPHARGRTGLRLAAMWLANVFERAEAFDTLREIYGTRRAVPCYLARDRIAVDGTSLSGALEDWIGALHLETVSTRDEPFAPQEHDESSDEVSGPAEITVVIPSYKHERFILATVDSALRQRRTPVKVLVVDDCSPDETVERARSIEDPRVRVEVNPSNLGLGGSLARALEFVDTPYVAILNSDDLFHPDRCFRCLDAMLAQPELQLVATGLAPIDDRGRLCHDADASPVFEGKQVADWLRWYEEEGRVDEPPADPFAALLQRNYLLTSSNLFGRTEFFRATVDQWRHLEFCLDWRLLLLAALDGKLGHLPEVALGYRLHASNTVWFDRDREWRYYLEASQVVADALQRRFEAGQARQEGFEGILDLVTSLDGNTVVDGLGIYIATLLNEQGKHPRMVTELSEQLSDLWSRKEAFNQAQYLARDYGADPRELYRVTHDHANLARIRNQYEALRDRVIRKDSQTHGLYFDRANFEYLWHEAERERDRAGQELGEIRGELDAARAERDQSIHELHLVAQEISTLRQQKTELLGDATSMREALRELHDSFSQLQQSFDDLQSKNQQIQSERDTAFHERDQLRWSAEHRFGDFLLNRLRLRRPLGFLIKALRRVQHEWSIRRLALQRYWPGNRRPRVMSGICWNFPIYSQTFVYQELTQLWRRGYAIRHVYSLQENRSDLHAQFAQLWGQRHFMTLNQKLHRRDLRRYRDRMPEKFEQLVNMLAEASGLTPEQVIHDANFEQAFTYTRMVEAWRPHYLHSYFFYDRTLMNLVAAFLLDLPRGVSCYADHLLEDFPLKVVALHLRLCNVVIATSARIKRELLGLAPEIDPDKILVKPNAIDSEHFPATERAEPEADHPFRITSVCRIEPKKGLIYLADAVRILRDRGHRVEMHLVGEADPHTPGATECAQELHDFLEQHSLWGTFHLEGRKNQQQVMDFLRMSHFFGAPFVETASGDKDGIPTALLEAMSTGIATVATNAGSMEEVITDGQDGLIVEQRDGEALADAFESLIRDPARRQQLGTAAATTIRNEFDVRVCEGRFHERLDLLLWSGKNGKAP